PGTGVPPVSRRHRVTHISSPDHIPITNLHNVGTAHGRGGKKKGAGEGKRFFLPLASCPHSTSRHSCATGSVRTGAGTPPQQRGAVGYATASNPPSRAPTAQFSLDLPNPYDILTSSSMGGFTCNHSHNNHHHHRSRPTPSFPPQKQTCN